MIRPGQAVLCSTASFEPVPGRVSASHDQPGHWWVTVCLNGWHQPQVFAEADLTVIGAGEVAGSGLCGECAAGLARAVPALTP